MSEKIFMRNRMFSKNSLDVAIAHSEGVYEFCQYRRRAGGFKGFYKFKETSSDRIGGNRRFLKGACSENWLQPVFPCGRSDPRQVKRFFAKAMGIWPRRTKSMLVLIARFAEAVKPETRPLRTEEEGQLDSLNARRFQDC